jgi:hypothetical protein
MINFSSAVKLQDGSFAEFGSMFGEIVRGYHICVQK